MDCLENKSLEVGWVYIIRAVAYNAPLSLGCFVIERADDMANQMHDFQSVMMTLLITITIPQFSRNGLMKLWRMRWILYYLLLNL